MCSGGMLRVPQPCGFSSDYSMLAVVSVTLSGDALKEAIPLSYLLPERPPWKQMRIGLTLRCYFMMSNDRHLSIRCPPLYTDVCCTIKLVFGVGVGSIVQVLYFKA